MFAVMPYYRGCGEALAIIVFYPSTLLKEISSHILRSIHAK
jgi:hypothetical protein